METSPKKHIVLFTGSHTVSLRRSLTSWKRLFTEKFGSFGISVHTPETLATLGGDIAGEILSTSLFGGKRMMVFDGIPLAGKA